MDDGLRRDGGMEGGEGGEEKRACPKLVNTSYLEEFRKHVHV